MEIVWATDADTLGIAFRPPTVEESIRSCRHDLGRGIKAWMSEDGETLYSLEIDGHASERVDLDELRLISCDRDGSSEQTASFPER